MHVEELPKYLANFEFSRETDKKGKTHVQKIYDVENNELIGK